MITGKLNLAALLHVKMEVDGQNGKVKGLFIPIANNSLFEGKEGAVYLDLVGFEYKEPKEYATHMLKQSFTKETRDKMTDDERQKLPIIGNLKVSDGNPKDTVANPDPETTYTPKKQLPF